MFRLVFLVCSLTTVLSDDCISQLTTCMTNAKTKHDTEMKTKMEAWKTKMDEMKTSANACFTSNGCTAPPPPTFNVTKNATHTNTVSANVTAHMEKLKTCMKESAGLVQTCVATNISMPTFKFPNMSDNGEHHFGEEHHFGVEHHDDGAWEHHVGNAHPDFAATFCSGNNASATLVKTCLHGLNATKNQEHGDNHGQEHGNNHDQEHGNNHGQEHRNPFCEVRDNCTIALNSTCKEQLNKIKAALCSCARNETKSSFAKCMGFNMTKPHQQKREALQSFNHGGAEGDHKQGEQGHQNFNQGFAMHNMGPEMFCTDPCDVKPQTAFGVSKTGSFKGAEKFKGAAGKGKGAGKGSR